MKIIIHSNCFMLHNTLCYEVTCHQKDNKIIIKKIERGKKMNYILYENIFRINCFMLHNTLCYYEFTCHQKDNKIIKTILRHIDNVIHTVILTVIECYDDSCIMPYSSCVLTTFNRLPFSV